MRHGRISDLIRRTAGALLLLGSVGVSTDTFTLAQDANCATPQPSCTPPCSDDVYKRAGERLAQHLQQVGSQSSGQGAMSCGNSGCANDGCVKESCLFGNLFAHGGAEESEPWSATDLFNDECGGNCLKKHNWKLSGNLAQSVTFNFGSPKDGINGPVTWTDQSNKYQLNQFWLTLERPTDTTEKDWDFGGRVDAFYGTNARFDTTGQLERKIDGQQFYGLALPQFYQETAYKKVKVKTGHFISPVGFFTVDMTQNFFNTIPYTYQYGEPFTHFGSLATWQATDKLVLGSGIIQGWDALGSSNHNAGWIGTAGYTWEDKSSIAYVGVWSNEPSQNSAIPAQNYTSRYFQTLVYSKPFAEKFTYVAQSDFGTQKNALASGGVAQWYGLNQYLFYQQTEKLAWGFNFEWFRDQNGFRVGTLLPNTIQQMPGSFRGLPAGRTGYAGNFYQMTMGPKWNIKKNVVLRPNLRFDFYEGDVLNAGGLKPFGDGQKNHQTILATDLYVTF